MQGHPVRFDQDTYNRMDGIDLKLLEYLDFLSRCQAKRSKTGARYCNPSERHLADKLRVSRETISHHVTKLAKLGVLSVQHRRKQHGRWMTNLYKVISSVWWRVRSLLQGFRRPLRRVKPSSHLTNPMGKDKPSEEHEGGATRDFASLRSAIEQYAPQLLRA